jgi:hypothetical protein
MVLPQFAQSFLGRAEIVSGIIFFGFGHDFLLLVF